MYRYASFTMQLISTTYCTHIHTIHMNTTNTH